METKLNTPLTIEQIDFRIQSINKGGYATILAYKDARVDMNRLDEVYGVDGWQKKYDLINGQLFCSVGVWNKTVGCWIWKQDVGTESMTEKEKGQASDAFKRACFNFGIGRELYDYPVIQIKLNTNEFKIENFGGKDVVKPTFELKIKEWKWESKFENGKLIKLICKDQLGKERFIYPDTKNPAEKPYLNENSQQFSDAVKFLKDGGTIDKIKLKYNISETVQQLLINATL